MAPTVEGGLVGEILAFLNSVAEPAELRARIRDDPNFSATSPGGYGVSLAAAERIIAVRETLPERRFTSLKQVDEVEGVGPITLHNILYSFEEPIMAETLAQPSGRLVSTSWMAGIMPYRNISYLGRCYDVAKLNPLDLGGYVHRNRGGTTTSMAIDLGALETYHASPDGTVLIPRGATYNPGAGAQLSSKAQRFFTAWDVQRAFSSDVSLGIGIQGIAAFGLSVGVESFSQEVGSREQMQTFMQAECEDCTIRFRDDALSLLPLDGAFVAAARALPLSNAKGAYNDFIGRFGTHFARGVTFGGRMYQRIDIVLTTLGRLAAVGVSVGASAEATYRNVTFQASGDFQGSMSVDLRQEAGCRVDFIRWVGGTPNRDFNAWVATVRNDPVPIHLELEPLTLLLAAAHDGENPDVVATKERLLTEVIERHAALPAVDPYHDQFFSFRSRNYPGHYVRHYDYRGKISAREDAALYRADATFRIVAGLADPAAYSFESLNYPGYFLRHQNWEIKLHKLDGTELFRKDATFRIKSGLAAADGAWRSFESVNYADHYIRHYNYLLRIDRQQTTALYKADATFEVGEPLAVL